MNVKLAVTIFLTLNIKMNTYVTFICITLSYPQEVYACRTYSGTPVFILNSPISAVSYFVVRRPFVDDSFTFLPNFLPFTEVGFTLTELSVT